MKNLSLRWTQVWFLKHSVHLVPSWGCPKNSSRMLWLIITENTYHISLSLLMKNFYCYTYNKCYKSYPGCVISNPDTLPSKRTHVEKGKETWVHWVHKALTVIYGVMDSHWGLLRGQWTPRTTAGHRGAAPPLRPPPAHSGGSRKEWRAEGGHQAIAAGLGPWQVSKELYKIIDHHKLLPLV